MAEWFETRFREPLDVEGPDAALRDRVRRLVVEEWQTDAGITPPVHSDTDPEGDVLMLETEDRRTSEKSAPPRKRRSPGRWLLVAAAAAIVAIVAAVLIGDDSGQPTDTVNSTTSVPDAGSVPGTVGASATIPSEPGGTAVRAIGDADGVWTHTPGKVVRFDVDTLEVVAEIPVERDGDLGGMLVMDGGSVFVDLGQGLAEIDTATDQVVRTFALPDVGARYGSPIAVSSDGLFASADRGARLVRFDRTTGAIAADRAFDDVAGVSSLVAVDGAIYVGVYPNTLLRLDPATLETVATAQVSAITITDVAVDGGQVMTLGFRGANGTLGVLDVLDRQSLALERPDPIELSGTYPLNLEVVDGQAYVAAKFTNLVHSYDIASGELSGDIEVAKTTESVDSGGGSTLWAVAWESQLLQRIDLG